MSPDSSIQVVNLQRLLNRFSNIERRMFSKSLMSEIGEFVISQIQIRTMEGKDVNNDAFAPYSKSYAAFRQKTGHSSTKVNLFYTGSMMGSMTQNATEDTVRIFFMNTQDKSGVSNPLKAFALHKKRKFFAVSAADQNGIMNLIRSHVDSVLEQR